MGTVDEGRSDGWMARVAAGAAGVMAISLTPFVQFSSIVAVDEFRIDSVLAPVIWLVVVPALAVSLVAFVLTRHFAGGRAAGHVTSIVLVVATGLAWIGRDAWQLCGSC